MVVVTDVVRVVLFRICSESTLMESRRIWTPSVSELPKCGMTFSRRGPLGVLMLPFIYRSIFSGLPLTSWYVMDQTGRSVSGQSELRSYRTVHVRSF